MRVGAEGRHIVIVGHMGSGKTTLGRALAQALGRPLCDSDEALLRTEGITARELQERGGPLALHEFEATHLLRALGARRPAVICAAASTIDDPRCVAGLRAAGAEVIWLRASPTTLAARHRRSRHRPPPVPVAVRRRREREFAMLDPHTLDSGRMSPGELLDAALAAVAH
jgi:shikimate kinase